MSNKINELLENLNRKIDIFPQEMDTCVDPGGIKKYTKYKKYKKTNKKNANRKNKTIKKRR